MNIITNSALALFFLLLTIAELNMLMHHATTMWLGAFYIIKMIVFGILTFHFSDKADRYINETNNNNNTE